MDLTWLLTLMMATTALSFTARRLLGRLDGRGWVLAWLPLLTLGGAHLVGWRGGAAVASGVYVVLILVPQVVAWRLARALTRRRFAAASRWAALLAALQPGTGWPVARRLYAALDLAERGDHEAARASLTELASDATPEGRLSRLQLFQLDADPAGLVEWAEGPVAAHLAREPGLLQAYLLALGETGAWQALARAYLAHADNLEGFGARVRSSVRLLVLAFGGRPDLVERLLEGPLGALPAGDRRLWMATARMAAGERARAEVELRTLLDAADGRLRVRAERRLASELPVVSGPDPAIERAERDLEHERAYAHESGTEAPVVTWALMALLLGVFLLEVWTGASTNGRQLLRMGAVDPRRVLDGEVWRLFAGAFLHADEVHVGVNTLTLWLLGPFVERRFGRARYLGLYLLTAAGSMAGVVLLYAARVIPERFEVGASGAVMGLIGASLAVLLHGTRAGSSLARRRLGVVLAVVVVQFALDLLTPQVSLSAHLTGAGLGFGLGWWLLRRQPS